MTPSTSAIPAAVPSDPRYGVDHPALDRHPIYAFALLSALYLIVVASLSSLKLLWFDELVTLHLARLGSVSAIWAALARAADPNPPLMHLAVLACRRLFGEHELALRLPALLGYWLGMVSLFIFLRRRLPGTWAIAGTLLSMANAGFDFSFESRSYGLFYGLTMLALLCWSRAVQPSATPTQRLAALAAMALALALAVSTNYFAVLAFLPIAGGELVLTWLRARRLPRNLPDVIDILVWIALALALTPLIAYRPLILCSVARFAPHAFNRVSLGQIPGAYFEMVEYILFPLLALFGVALIARWNSRRPTASKWLPAYSNTEALPPHELAAALILMLYPVLGCVLAKLYGGMFSARFVLPVCLGFAIAGALAGFRLIGHLPRAGNFAVALLLAWFLAREAYVAYTYNDQKHAFYQVLNALPAASYPGPIVLADPLFALPFERYAPPALVARALYPIDFPAIRRLRGDDSPEENLWAGRSTLYSLPLVPLTDFERTPGVHLVVAADGNWLIQTLKADHIPVQRLPIDTHAEAIGGFTPLAHGVPAFFVAPAVEVCGSSRK